MLNYLRSTTRLPHTARCQPWPASRVARKAPTAPCGRCACREVAVNRNTWSIRSLNFLLMTVGLTPMKLSTDCNLEIRAESSATPRNIPTGYLPCLPKISFNVGGVLLNCQPLLAITKPRRKMVGRNPNASFDLDLDIMHCTAENFSVLRFGRIHDHGLFGTWPLAIPCRKSKLLAVTSLQR